MTDYIERWNSRGPKLQALLDVLQPRAVGALPSVARDISVTRNHGDRPELNLRWSQRDAITRVLQVIIEDSATLDDEASLSVTIEGAAWIDVDGLLPGSSNGGRHRRWMDERFGSHLPLSAESASSANGMGSGDSTAAIDRQLRQAAAVISGWGIERLAHDIPLPPVASITQYPVMPIGRD